MFHSSRHSDKLSDTNLGYAVTKQAARQRRKTSRQIAHIDSRKSIPPRRLVSVCRLRLFVLIVALPWSICRTLLCLMCLTIDLM